MKKKNNKKWALVLVLLLVVSIGYAALASNLKINGTTGVKSATWDVYWNNVQVTQGSVATTQGNGARITDQKKTQVEYSVTLNEPGDFYEFTVDAVNNGSIDAMIEEGSILKGVYSDSNYTQSVTLPKTVSYTVTYADGTTIEPKHLLAKKTNGVATTETYKVRIEYKNDDSINPGDLNNTNDLTYYFKFSVNYVQADDNKIARNGGIQTPNIDPYSFEGTCPGCIFAHNGSDEPQLINSLLSITPFTSAELENTDLGTVYGQRVSSIFLGYKVEEGVVTHEYVCTNNEGLNFCLEGGNNSYERNIDILNHIFNLELSSEGDYEYYCLPYLCMTISEDSIHFETNSDDCFFEDGRAYCFN